MRQCRRRSCPSIRREPRRMGGSRGCRTKRDPEHATTPRTTKGWMHKGAGDEPETRAGQPTGPQAPGPKRRAWEGSTRNAEFTGQGCPVNEWDGMHTRGAPLLSLFLLSTSTRRQVLPWNLHPDAWRPGGQDIRANIRPDVPVDIHPNIRAHVRPTGRRAPADLISLSRPPARTPGPPSPGRRPTTPAGWSLRPRRSWEIGASRNAVRLGVNAKGSWTFLDGGVASCRTS